MNPSYIEIVVLYCLKKIRDERTIYSIVHLLHGKKSSQTIQDAHFFKLTSFFQTFVNLTRNDLEEIVKKYERLGWIEKKSEQNFILNKKGQNELDLLMANYPFPKYLNGWKFHNKTRVFWERFSLLVQVFSHLNINISNYFPIQRDKDIHNWLKNVIKEIKLPKNKLATSLYEEILQCVNDKDINPSYIVLRLTGYNHIGLTAKQAADVLMVDPYYYHYYFLAVLHFMMDRIASDINNYPILSLLITDYKEDTILTNSTRITYELLKKGYTIQKIAEIRKLKISTIEDHLVEICLNMKDFSIDLYVNEEKQRMIKRAIFLTPSKQLKQIREKVEDANYFEIRLVIAKYGENIES